MTKLLKASLILATPLLFAAYGDRDDSTGTGASISVGAEGYVNVLSIGWGAQEATAASSAINTSNFVYGEAQDKHPNYSFGGAVIARTDLTEDFSALFRFGFEAGPADGIGVSSNAANNDFGVTPSTWKSKMVMAPGAFIGFKGLYLGAVYDMREYEITNSGIDAENKTLKENQILFGMRGETLYSMEDMNITVAFEGLSNFGQKADSDVEQWYTNVLNGISTISTVHTNFTKLSLSLGMMFADF